MNAAQPDLGTPDPALPHSRPLRAVRGGQSPAHRDPGTSPTGRQLQDLWDHHGTAVYALACAVLGEERAAMQAVTLGMTDVARSHDSVAARDARRSLSRHVYCRSLAVLGDPSLPRHLPPAMLWVADMAPLQRACLALCCFGGHTYTEAAELLGVPAVTVAELLTAGLREMARFPVARSATATR
jgi:hypothetical protein